MFSRFAAVIGAVALTTSLASGPIRAHEGHDHGESPAAARTVASPRAEAASADFELVAVARDGRLTVYLDRFATNEPVANAAVTLEAPDGPVPLEAGPEGIHTGPAAWLTRPGQHELLFTVVAEGGAEVLPVTLTIPEAPSTGPGPGMPVAVAVSERLIQKDPVMMAVAAAAFLLGIAVTVLVRRGRAVPAAAALVFAAVLVTASAGSAHEGHSHEQAREPARAPAIPPQGDLAQRLPDGTVFAPKPTQRVLAIRTVLSEPGTYRRTIELPGRIIPDPNASGVVQSSVGGRLSAPESGFPRLGSPVKKGAVLAYVTPAIQRVDVSDMRQRQGELDQQAAILQRRVERFQKLASTGAVAQVQLEEALDELRGVRERRRALDEVRSQPEPLVAPVDGIVAETAAVAGQMAAPGTVIFQVVDPRRLWVEALTFEPIAPAEAATARLPDGRSLRLRYQGSGFSDRNQAFPVQFAVEGDTAGLRLGQFLTVQAATHDEVQGLALPRASVVRASNGQDVVYEHTHAEVFAARPVRVMPLDGERVLVAGGLSAGKRIVTQGGELLDQVR